MTVQEILTAAIADLEQYGFDSEERFSKWEALLREAIRAQMKSQAQIDAEMRRQLRSIYERLVERAQVLKYHPGVKKFNLATLAAHLHMNLEQRIMASAQLIRLNRDEMVNKTLRRFSGWLTSVPKGGSDTIDKRAVKEEIAKPLRQLPFAERRLLIDQSSKLNASISAVIAQDNGAIAAKWSSHWRQLNYNYREDHKERDGKVYLVKDSWAATQGLVKVGDAGWSDEITQPAEEPFCRCRWVYMYHLRQLPDSMLTAKGKEALTKARAA